MVHFIKKSNLVLSVIFYKKIWTMFIFGQLAGNSILVYLSVRLSVSLTSILQSPRLTMLIVYHFDDPLQYAT